jgi:TolB-like protein/Tfp pilus assembly protein PilF
VLEGSLRQNGPICRLTVRLVETATGSQLWSHAFDRRIDADHVFAVQDEWVSAIVARVGDQHGALVRDMVRTFGNKKPEELTAHEAVLSVLSFHERMSQQEHARLRSILERLVKESPDSSDCWAMLATLYNDEYMFGFPGEPDPLARARDAAQRAFELAPANPLACQAQFQSLFFRKEWQAFRPVAERTLALNPLDSATVAFAGILLTLSGAWDLGCGAIESAIRLNPDHPSWYWLGPVFRAFHLEDYQAAADLAMRLYMPGYFWGPAALASAYGHLDQPEAAQRALKELLAVRPDFARTARAEFEKWMSPELADRFVAGLAKAGVATGGVATGAAVSVSSQGASGSSSGGGFWIAVPAFRAIGTHPDVAALQESFAEEIIAGLCRFPYLRVLTKGTAGARYILEGNLRQAGQQLRVAVRLIETTTGANLWAENYSRTFSPEAPFEIQESLVPTIVSTIGETNGVLTHSMWTSLRDRDPLTLTPYEAMLRCFGALETQSPEELTLAAVALERAVEQEPRNSGCLAMLAVVHTHSYGLGYSKHPDPVEAGLSYARRAVTAEPSNHLAHLVLAMAQFFRNDAIAFRAAADRALALNPMDGYTLANLGMRTAYLGDWDRGCEMVRRAMQLNPRHPGWYWLPLLANAYRNRDFTAALGMAQQMNMPGLWHAAAVVVAIHGQLGNRKEARMAIRELAQLGVQDPRPSFERYLLDPEIMALFVDGWRKAGLYDAPESDSGMSRSGSARAGDGFWVAVLPFEAVGSEAAAVFADGLFEETLTGMSRFSYLRLIARSSVRQYAGSRSDVRAIGRELGARYVMEGSVRQAGAQIRLTVQISDVSTGAQLWTETFNRPFDPEQIFALQDELAPRIVCTVSDSFGVLVRAMSDELRRKPDEDLTPHDAVLLAFGYVFRHTAEDHLRARTALERAVEAEPDNASCWAMLSTIYLNEHMHGWNPQPDPVGRSLAAARRAVDLGPTNSMAHYARAAAQFFAKRFAEFRADAERALQLNPWDGITLAWVGALWASCLDWDEGEALLLRAQSYNPTHPYWYHSTSVWNRYRRGEYAAALDRLQGIRISVPDPLWASLRAAVFGQLGQTGPAREALDELCRLRPDFPGQLRAWLETFFQPEMVQHILDGLRKAGLEQPSTAGVRGDGFWIAVAPFQAEGGDTAVLASGLSAELITALSRFTYLRVLTKGAAGARYVVEGAVRQAGAQVRVSTKLIDTQTAANLWAESYTRPCTPETVFEVLAALIASSIGDSHGVLPRSISNSLRSRKPEELTPYEAVLRSFGYPERGTPEELVLARDALRGALSKEPDYADALAMLSFLLVQDYAHGFDLTPDALLEGTALARRAVELAPSSSLSWRSLAQALFFQRDDGFRNAAERAVALNPQDADTLAFAGELLMYRGDSTRGLELSAAAKRLSPNHTGWYWYADTFHAEYNLCDSAAALGYLNRIQLDKHYALHLFKASVLGHLGQREAAARSLGRFVELRPDAAQRIRSHMSRWWSNEHVDRLMEGLRRAGLGATRSEDAFRVAVAPFRVESGGSEVAALASGLSEEIVTALSRFTCLRALPKGTDGARYVLEGSVRQMGAQLRVAVRLLDTSSGNHLWAETYSRAYSPDRIFEVQDELVPVIVSPVAETNGALEHNMWIALRDRDPLTLTPFEALLRSRGFFELHTVDEYRLAIATLKRAVEQEPNHAGCLASLSWIYSLGYLFGWDMEADPAGLGLSYARRAVGAEPACQEAHVALLYAYACRKEIGGVRTAAERVLALNPFNGFAVFVTGLWRAYSGDWQEGCELVRKAQGLNPRHTGSYWYPLAHAALRRSDYEGGLKCALSINLPGQFWTHLLLAVAHSGLGQATEAAAAVKDLLALEPEFAASARHRIARWFFEDSHVELLLHGLRKAGLVVGTLPGGSTLAPEPPRQLLGTPAGMPAHSLAVLPFANLGGDKDQEYFSDGLAEEILNLL